MSLPRAAIAESFTDQCSPVFALCSGIVEYPLGCTHPDFACWLQSVNCRISPLSCCRTALCGVQLSNAQVSLA